MRPLSAALLAAVAVACAPSEQPPTDTATIPAGVAADSAARLPDATATPLPAPPESARARPVAPAPSGTAGTRATPRTSGATPAPRGTATDTGTGPRIRPPSKAPGGYIIVPNTVHDSLRMKPPATGTTTGTSTRP